VKKSPDKTIEYKGVTVSPMRPYPPQIRVKEEITQSETAQRFNRI
jgi:hypothetical protein